MITTFVAVGSNAQRKRHVRSAVLALRSRFNDLLLSSVYESAALGCEAPPFFNLVVKFTTTQEFEQLCSTLRQLENSHAKPNQLSRHQCCTLDIDLLLFGDLISKKTETTGQVPRDDILNYAFVLQPLAEIAADRLHPVLNRSYADLWHEYDKTDLQQRRIAFALT